MGTFILLLVITCFGCGVVLTYKAFSGDSILERIIGIIATCLLGILVAVIHIANLEEVRHKTMQDYFEGKIEVIEQIDTTRTFKFN